MEKISAENSAELEKHYRKTVFIVIGQIFTTVIFIIAAWLAASDRAAPPSAESFLALWMVVLFLAAGTFVLRRILFGWERLKNITLLKGFSGLIKTLQINAIILNAAAEAVVVLGFLISIFSGNGFDAIRAGLVALVIFLLNFPRRSVWEKIVLHLEKV